MPTLSLQAAVNENFDGSLPGSNADTFDIAGVVNWTGPGLATLNLDGFLANPAFVTNQLYNAGNPAFLTLTIDFTQAQNSYNFPFAIQQTPGPTVNAAFTVQANFLGAPAAPADVYGPFNNPGNPIIEGTAAGAVVFDQLVITVTNATAWLIDTVVTTNQPVGATIIQSGGTTNITEGGATDTYTVVLTSRPIANVTVTLNPDAQCTTAPSPLTFTPANWNVAQTVTVTAVDDAVIEGAHTCTIGHTFASTDAGYNGLVVANVVANVTDNDAIAGVTVTESGGTTDVAEGGATDTYTVVLDAAPTANVTITVTPDAQCTALPSPLTFTIANWNVAQIVTVTAVDDAVAEGVHTCTITHAAASGDAAYNGIAINNVVANITDNDVAGVTVTESGGTTDITEGGVTDTYTVVLNTAPTANVTITVTPDAQCTALPSPLTFTPANWNVAQTVTVTAVNDVLAEGPHTCTITHAAASGDAAYNAIAINNVVANVTDNDVAGVTVTESGGTTDVAEGGVTDTYTIVLNTAPTVNVTITVAPDAQCTALPSPLTFTPANWNVAQTVTVTAVDDAAPEGAHTCTIGHTAASGDAAYNAIAIANVLANVADNDVPGVTVSAGAVNIAEGGGTGNYTLTLNTIPAGNVEITLTPDAQCVIVSANPVIFVAPAQGPITVTVQAVDDAAIEGAHTCTITHAITTSADANYPVGMAINNKVVNIADNDGVIPPGPGVVVEEVVPPQPPCADLNGQTNRIVRANVQDSTVANGSVFCRIINENSSFVQSANEIGDQSVLDRGVLQAVDVFGLSYTGNPVTIFNLPVNICLMGSGSIIYLDATAAPRVPTQLAATSQGGYTCANIPNAGTVVLVPGAAAPAANSETASSNPQAIVRTPAAEVHELASCRVTTTNAVRMRTEPNTDSTIVTRLEFNVTRSANARSGNWFRVVNGGDQGWVSGDFLNWVGSCGD